MAKLDPEQVKFMQTTQVMIAAKGNFPLTAPSQPVFHLSTPRWEADGGAGTESYIRRVRDKHKYEQSMYWTGQLFSVFDTSPVQFVEDPDEEGDEKTLMPPTIMPIPPIGLPMTIPPPPPPIMPTSAVKIEK